MITDESVRQLVADMRRIARECEGDKTTPLESWRKCMRHRADAYRLAAEWLEALIVPDEEADSVSDSGD